ncbi:MAG TPA: c-type cytochrome, partial [Pirellulaceae bacterium]|nr:c-type cytochrome [Pirellulaceae bacterium]
IKELTEGAEDKAALRGKLHQAALALAAEAEFGSQHGAVPVAAGEIEAGRKLIAGELGCTDCHRFHDAGELGNAPDLTGYGSRAWLAKMIANPQGERFYAGDRNDRMPAFAADPQQPKHNLLGPQELDLVVAWLRGEWHEPERLAADDSAKATAEAARK